MSKMLWEVKAPLVIAKAKEDLGLNNIFKYMRYYRMFLERFRWTYKGVDLTNRIESKLFWRGKIALVNDAVYGLVVAEIDTEKVDPNGAITKISASAENGWSRKNLEVGKDAIILYSDETYFAPVLYIWAIANKIIEREDIIDSQDNMLRKPIVVTGEGAELDNAMNKVANVLSGIAWFNLKPDKKKTDIMSDKGLEVLNLQTGNAYKGKELWESRGKYEELIKDYLGYSSVNNQKKERMIQAEVSESKSVCETFYKSSLKNREEAQKKCSELFGEELKFEKVLEEEVEEDVSQKNNMENSGNSDKRD